MIQIVSISTNLGTNRSTVQFKEFDTSTPIHRMLGEYQVEIDGRYDNLDSRELNDILYAMLHPEDEDAAA